MDFKDTNPLGIIGIIGAIILVVGVFLAWLTPDTAAMQLLFGDKAYSGWDIQGNLNGIKDASGLYQGLGYAFVPLVALICGIISLIIMIVPTVMNADKFKQINNILGIVALILAIVVVVCGILFWMQSITWGTGSTTISYKLTELYKIGIGFWLVLVGGIITMVGGLMPIIKDKLM